MSDRGGHEEVPHGTAGYHPHESPLSMLVPLGLLSLGAIAAGFLFHHAFIEPEGGPEFWRGALAFDEHLMHAMHEVPLLVKLSATIAMLLGLALAYAMYVRSKDAPARAADTFRVGYHFILNKWYFDELYHLLFVRPAFWFGRFFWRRGDEKTIDRFGPNGAAWVTQMGARAAAKLQTGYVYTYAFVMLIGLTAAVTWAIAG